MGEGGPYDRGTVAKTATDRRFGHSHAGGTRRRAVEQNRIPVDDRLSIGEEEISESFIRSGGAGGQNVNKVSSAVQLRFDVRNSPSLPERVKARLEAIAGAKLTKDGVIVFTANRFRTQEANRKDAVERLVELIRQATFVPKHRVKTRPSLGSKQRRLEGKTKRAEVKKLRGGRVRAED
jgi:ribosome-associated protein